MSRPIASSFRSTACLLPALHDRPMSATSVVHQQSTPTTPNSAKAAVITIVSRTQPQQSQRASGSEVKQNSQQTATVHTSSLNHGRQFVLPAFRLLLFQRTGPLPPSAIRSLTHPAVAHRLRDTAHLIACLGLLAMYLLIALTPSAMACLDRSPGSSRRHANIISRPVSTCFLL